MQNIKLGKYKHFKGGEYQVLGVAKHSESLETMVVYKPLYELEQGVGHVGKTYRDVF